MRQHYPSANKMNKISWTNWLHSGIWKKKIIILQHVRSRKFYR